MAATVTLACLKTAVGLITSCSETFSALFPKALKYRTWAIIFTLVSFAFANLGLSLILEFSLPVLMFLYPLAITLILLSLFGKFFGYDRRVYAWVTGCTLVAAVYDLMFALPASVKAALRLEEIISAVGGVLPLSGVGLGWLCPAAVGLVIGLLLHKLRPAKA